MQPSTPTTRAPVRLKTCAARQERHQRAAGARLGSGGIEREAPRLRGGGQQLVVGLEHRLDREIRLARLVRRTEVRRRLGRRLALGQQPLAVRLADQHGLGDQVPLRLAQEVDVEEPEERDRGDRQHQRERADAQRAAGAWSGARSLRGSAASDSRRRTRSRSGRFRAASNLPRMRRTWLSTVRSVMWWPWP